MSCAEVSPPHRAEPRQTQTPLSWAKKVRDERTTQKEKVSMAESTESSRADKISPSGLRELHSNSKRKTPWWKGGCGQVPYVVWKPRPDSPLLEEQNSRNKGRSCTRHWRSFASLSFLKQRGNDPEATGRLQRRGPSHSWLLPTATTLQFELQIRIRGEWINEFAGLSLGPRNPLL